ncbi:hypothetical protein BRN01_21780 [Xanthomonas oryzae pv. oryzae]|nr:hypothetical protein DXO331_00485 [Xanthomonas oryzae pv. oryzae]PNR35598.1 hypothetical protein LA06_15885 [Xanthomonas oryzae pv. oryzae]PNR54654.1 hypothetical protein LA07_16425 [Xanthomonas oryzae pv. oryzae]PNR89146.1 hypothetical protein LA09_09235 [Xanthomonas oryzae pv. oryzae]RBA86311.1 hypothetical protein BRN79_19370 [Xanthomonas oryzae pv. oryzae]
MELMLIPTVTEFDLKQSAFFGIQGSVLFAHATTLRQGGVLHLEVEFKQPDQLLISQKYRRHLDA